MGTHKALVINGFTISRSTNGLWQAVKNGRQWFTNTDKDLVIEFCKRAG